ncbi:hypothetical protein ACIBBE_24925 [Streptomyces sp. NPDC051644]|uniref:hypothetical protein n=1 Tax=Streptomyces sp. NPDC051644 TaxID=3365666 RepID=UPI0037B606B9
MTILEGPVKFFNAYLGIEYAGNMAVYAEPDEVVNELRKESMKHWHALSGVPLSPSFGRPMGMPAEILAQLAESAKVVRRPLFLVAEYNDRTWGTLYAGYIGGDRARTAQSYGGLLYAAEINDTLKIIASYKEDTDKASPPMHWRHSQGAEISLSGPPVATHPLEAPAGRATHYQDWEAFRNAAAHR